MEVWISVVVVLVLMDLLKDVALAVDLKFLHLFFPLKVLPMLP